MRKFFVPLLWLVLSSFSLRAQQERILNYDVQIEVNRDRSIMVTEFIEVQVTGDVIKRGITRNLPTQRDLNGQQVGVRYSIREVAKNGEKESYHTESGNGQMVLYLGERDVYLDPGVYTYKIRYRVPNQIEFYDEYDEIYWNVIGHDVQFPIEQASARVRPPQGATVIQEAGYTGFYGDQGKDFRVTQEGEFVDYRTTRTLQPNEGFSVAVGFEKGFVSQPGLLQRFGTLIIILLGLTFLLPYYFITWMRYGQDPPTPPSYPLWDAPEGLSPASVNYVLKGTYDVKSFTASVISLAIKGYLRIEEVVKKGFLSKKKHFDLVLEKEADADLPPEEKQLLEKIFRHQDRVSIAGKYDSNIENTYTMHKGSLSAQHRSFLRKGDNTRLLWIPILVTIVVGAFAVFLSTRGAYMEGINMRTLLMFIPAAAGGIFLYAYLIKRPSEEKLDLRSRIKGLQMYLELTEKDRLNLFNPPEMTPEHFEKELPYAFALGVEHKWSEKFENILKQAQYQPRWHNSRSPVYFSNHFGRDFSKNLSSAATKPSKSGSGSGGGGFSGGGGGGGGVGGW